MARRPLAILVASTMALFLLVLASAGTLPASASSSAIPPNFDATAMSGNEAEDAPFIGRGVSEVIDVITPLAKLWFGPLTLEFQSESTVSSDCLEYLGVVTAASLCWPSLGDLYPPPVY